MVLSCRLSVRNWDTNVTSVFNSFPISFLSSYSIGQCSAGVEANWSWSAGLSRVQDHVVNKSKFLLCSLSFSEEVPGVWGTGIALGDLKWEALLPELQTDWLGLPYSGVVEVSEGWEPWCLPHNGTYWGEQSFIFTPMDNMCIFWKRGGSWNTQLAEVE